MLNLNRSTENKEIDSLESEDPSTLPKTATEEPGQH